MRALAPCVLLLAIFLLSSSLMAVERADSPSPPRALRVLVIYDSRCKLSLYYAEYIRWLYGTMWRLSVELLDDAAMRLNSSLFFEGGRPRYAIIFFVNVVDGVDREDPDEWRLIIERVNGSVPLVFLGKAPALPQVGALVGCVDPKPKDVTSVEVVASPLTEGLPAHLGGWIPAIVCRPTSGRPLIREPIGGGALLVVHGMNAWFGLRVEALGWRPLSCPLAVIFRRLIRLSPLPYALPRLPELYVALRLDDIPYTTESWFWGWEYFTPEGWRSFFNMLAAEGAKVDLMIVPFNVSKSDGRWTPYNVTHAGAIEAIKEAIEAGIAEVGCHGATHVNPFQHYFMRADPSDPMAMTQAIRYEFGWDPNTGRPIPYEVQLHHIKISTEVIEDWFGMRPVVFTPPWHIYNDDTVRALESLGYRYLSADFHLLRDHEGRRPPCPLGEYLPGTRLMCVPCDESWSSFPTTFREVWWRAYAYEECGVPLIFIDHGRNWTFGGTHITFTISECRLRIRALRRFMGARFVFLSELGELLERWHDLKVDIEYLNRSALRAIIIVPEGANLSMVLELGPRAPTKILLDGRPLPAVSTQPRLSLVPGEHEVVALFPCEAPSAPSRRAGFARLAILLILLAAVAAFLGSRRRSRAPEVRPDEVRRSER